MEDLLENIVSPITDWYRENRREMPWRTDATPYHVWISEIMLQQTRIEAVIPYYHRFLAAFPTVEDLSRAEEDRLMKLWEGLGYYSRARNLKKAAEILTKEHGGQLPSSADALRKLPGIGEYTAGAIASIAYGQAAPAVDGNVLRVVSRLAALSDDILLPATKKAVANSLKAVYPTGQAAADLTQGLMELGERICLPNGLPRCEICPVRFICRAHAQGREENYPVKSAKKARKVEEKTVLLLSCGERFALRRRPKNGLLAGLWELPNTDGFLSADEVKQYLKDLGVKALSCKSCGSAKHIFTHVEWHMTGYAVACDRMSDAFVWKTADEIGEAYAIPTAFRFYVKKI